MRGMNQLFLNFKFFEFLKVNQNLVPEGESEFNW